MLSISDNPDSATACGLQLHLKFPCLKMSVHNLALAQRGSNKRQRCVCSPLWVHESCCVAHVGEDGSLWSETEGKETDCLFQRLSRAYIGLSHL